MQGADELPVWLEEREHGMQGAHILLVEDEDILCDLIKRNLQARHHEVSVATNVEAALACLRTDHFDLIVLDINLPDKTGWDVLRTALREHAINPLTEGENQGKLPVVVLSAVRANSSRLAEFRPLAYLPKPFPMEALLRLAAEAARHKQPTSPIEEKTDV